MPKRSDRELKHIAETIVPLLPVEDADKARVLELVDELWLWETGRATMTPADDPHGGGADGEV